MFYYIHIIHNSVILHDTFWVVVSGFTYWELCGNFRGILSFCVMRFKCIAAGICFFFLIHSHLYSVTAIWFS